MAVNRRPANVGYGLSNALQTLAPEPLVMTRNPSQDDMAPIGTTWINKSNNGYFFLTSISGGVANWQGQVEGELRVDGDVVIAGGGAIIMNGLVIVTGAGSPNGIIDADAGSLYLRTDPAGATSRIYVNTNGATAWTNVTCAA